MARLTKAERDALRAKRRAQQAEYIKILEAGKCPQCGSPLRRNNALYGWWQCSQYGAEGFRADSSKPDCSFQLMLYRPEDL